jgi:hypothetical protein
MLAEKKKTCHESKSRTDYANGGLEGFAYRLVYMAELRTNHNQQLADSWSY